MKCPIFAPHKEAAIAQLVERFTRNEEVPSSSLGCGSGKENRTTYGSLFVFPASGTADARPPEGVGASGRHAAGAGCPSRAAIKKKADRPFVDLSAAAPQVGLEPTTP